MLTATIATVIMIIVTGIIIYALIKFRKSAGYQPDQNFNNTWFGRWSWVLVPAIVLGIDFSIAGPASKVLASVETYDDADVTVKVIGSQWKWTYEYMDDDIRIVSNLNKEVPNDDDLYLRDVDNPLVLPTNKRIRFLHTATDVLHAWWVPAIAYKKDSIPGYINETWTVIEKEGTYRGQCAENCGTGHAFMPIVVNAVSEAEYEEWKNGMKVAAAAAAAEASADKTWSKDELMQRGETLYNTNCGACHMPTGLGIPNVFPALKGSPVATGDVAKHLETVIKGVAGTAMAPWGGQLNDLEIAAIVTYERNAWGNDTGDVVQPADVKAAR
jgi:cytochrome c oxidase subunit 2